MSCNDKHVPKTFIVDVDGVLTDGSFTYSQWGKQFKTFGAEDHDALKALAKYLDIAIVTADRRGFKISKRRIVHDMRLPLTLISAEKRTLELSSLFSLRDSIYMGDSFHDIKVFQNVMYSIAPANALPEIQAKANFVTKSRGGDRAVAEACRHIALNFFSVDLFA